MDIAAELGLDGASAPRRGALAPQAIRIDPYMHTSVDRQAAPSFNVCHPAECAAIATQMVTQNWAALLQLLNGPERW